MQPLRHNHQVGEEHKYEKLVVFRADCNDISLRASKRKLRKADWPSPMFRRAVRRLA